MTSIAIAEEGTMTGKGPRPDWTTWREVLAAWTVAVVLAGALLLSMPRHDAGTPPANIWSLSPAAGHPHHASADAEGPFTDQACTDRDYASERC
jgi:hypothetical protein